MASQSSPTACASMNRGYTILRGRRSKPSQVSTNRNDPIVSCARLVESSILIDLIRQRLTSYHPKDALEEEQAIKEILQEVAHQTECIAQLAASAGRPQSIRTMEGAESGHQHSMGRRQAQREDCHHRLESCCSGC